MEYPDDLKYTKEHEWIRIEGSVLTIGITDYAQNSLGDVVYLELPEEGSRVSSGEPFGVVESVKAVSDIYSPASGVVIEVNSALVNTPEIVNEDPYGEAWMIKARVEDNEAIGDLLATNEYRKYIEEEG